MKRKQIRSDHEDAQREVDAAHLNRVAGGDPATILAVGAAFVLWSAVVASTATRY